MENGAKPGYKTTEFWLSLAAIVIGAVLGAGVESAVVVKCLSIGSAVLAAMGYTFVRGSVKNSG